MKGVVTFDFDDTLFSLSEEKVGMLWASSEVLVPIQKVHDLLWEKHNEGYIIDIITSRESWNLPEVKQYIEEYKLQGYTIFRGVLSKELCQELTDSILDESFKILFRERHLEPKCPHRGVPGNRVPQG
jgi:FMN phosphatase YigB (HAD superfamily)